MAVLGALMRLELRDGSQMREIFSEQVDRRLDLPESEQKGYAERLTTALGTQKLSEIQPQFILLVDRSRFVQAVMLYWLGPNHEPMFIGASPVSTGRPGRYEYFETPVGVFEHSIDNPDFRALGTKNEFGIRGYGLKGMRVYDFGWIKAPRGWGDGHEGALRLQMHATDPDLLDRYLGTARSKGCIRIPAALNVLIDHYGLLDADYEVAMAEGETFFVMLPAREPTPWSGRYLVIVDTERTERPSWSPVSGH